ncbi:hypothetical protein LZ554_008294 [Drepanopeziza brunnea f. sp. 'monogermtubi']|nr:hypothetical protein LZ554_008294 [Drepanopeziza brunnea f. sp. 'monogermtubi']
MLFSSSFAAAAAVTLLTLATATTGITVLDPVSKFDCSISPDYSLKPPVGMSEKIDTAPKKNLTLYYESNSTPVVAEVTVAMKHPSVLLEDIPDIIQVACTQWTVAITFNTSTAYQKSASTWPSSSFIIFTNHFGNCDAEYERGIYHVDGLTFNSSTLTIIASITSTSFHSTTERMDISFLSPATAAAAEAAAISKRAISASFSSDFPYEVTFIDDAGLLISASDTHISGGFNLSGRVSYDFWNFEFTNFYLELSLHAAFATTVNLNTSIPNDASQWTFDAVDLSVHAFEIANILSIGPTIGFGLGVDVSAAGHVNVSAGMGANLEGGLVHLDLLDATDSYTTGWAPVYTREVNISGAVQAQLNPFLSLTAGFGADFLDGLVSVGAGVMVKSQIVNKFNVTSPVHAGNGTVNGTAPLWGNSTCRSGIMYASDFAMDVSAYVDDLYSMSLYELDLVISESRCWRWG